MHARLSRCRTPGVSYLESARACPAILSQYSVVWPVHANEAKVRVRAFVLICAASLSHAPSEDLWPLPPFCSGPELLADVASRGGDISLANASMPSQPFSNTFVDSRFYMPAQVFDTETVVEVTHKITAALEASEVFNSY